MAKPHVPCSFMENPKGCSYLHGPGQLVNEGQCAAIGGRGAGRGDIIVMGRYKRLVIGRYYCDVLKRYISDTEMLD